MTLSRAILEHTAPYNCIGRGRTLATFAHQGQRRSPTGALRRQAERETTGARQVLLVQHGGNLSTVVRAVSHVYTVRSPAPNWRSNCGAQHYPPAMAPTMSKGSAPVATAAGSGASGDSWDRSCSQAKNRTNARRRCVTWSRIVPRNIG